MTFGYTPLFGEFGVTSGALGLVFGRLYSACTLIHLKVYTCTRQLLYWQKLFEFTFIFNALVDENLTLVIRLVVIRVARLLITSGKVNPSGHQVKQINYTY